MEIVVIQIRRRDAVLELSQSPLHLLRHSSGRHGNNVCGTLLDVQTPKPPSERQDAVGSIIEYGEE